jgi:hypothetical protein
MDQMRYRKPSVKTVLGITKMKKRLNKALGTNSLFAPFRAVGNYQRRLLLRAGYYSPEMKALRAARRGQVPGPIGALELGTHEEHEPEQQSPAEAVLLAAALSKRGEKQHAQRQKAHDQQSSGLAQAMLLAAALQNQDEEHEHSAAREWKTTHAPQTEKRSAVEKR